MFLVAVRRSILAYDVQQSLYTMAAPPKRFESKIVVIVLHGDICCSYRVQVIDLVFMKMIFRFMIVLVVVRAQFEEMRQRWEQEQNEFEQEFLRSCHTNNKW